MRLALDGRSRAARADRVGARRAREARVRGSGGSTRAGACSSRAPHRCPGIRLRSSSSRVSKRPEGDFDAALVAGEARCRRSPDRRGGRASRPSSSTDRAARGGAAAARRGRRHRPPAACQRRPGRPRGSRLPRRPPHSAARDGDARASRSRRRDPRSTATTRSPGRSLVRDAAPRRCRSQTRASARHSGSRSSTSTAATRKDCAGDTRSRCATGTSRRSS